MYQEFAVFLLEKMPKEKDGQTADFRSLTREQTRDVLRLFDRHIREHLLQAYGFTRTGQSRMGRSISGRMPEHAEHDESYDTALADDFWEKQEQAQWLLEHVTLCKSVLLSSDRPRKSEEWVALSHYLDGKNIPEIAGLMKVLVKDARRLLHEAIQFIREQSGLKGLPHIEISYPHEIRKDVKIAQSQKEKREVIINLNPLLKLSEIMERYGVSKSTAFRMLRMAQANNGRAWFTPDFHVRRDAAYRAMKEREQEPPSVSEGNTELPPEDPIF